MENEWNFNCKSGVTTRLVRLFGIATIFVFVQLYTSLNLPLDVLFGTDSLVGKQNVIHVLVLSLIF